MPSIIRGWILALLFISFAAQVAVARQPFGFEAMPWQEPILERLPDLLRITVEDRPAGILLTRKIEAPGRHRLIIEGRGGPMTLRLKLDAGPYEYLAAPNDVFERLLSNVQMVEALIYADKPATYELLSARLEPCPECRSIEETIAAWTAMNRSGVPLEATPWEAPTLVLLPDAVQVVVKDQPGGVLLTQSIVAPGRHRLIIAGRGGPMTLRLKLDDGDYEYLEMPSDGFERTLVNVRKLEALLYSDTPVSYELVQARLVPCPSCKTVEDLVARVRTEIPGIDGMAPLDKMTALLHWSASVSDYTDSSSFIPADFEAWEGYDALFHFFDRDVGGVSCGGMAAFAKSVFHSFGIDAFTVNYGVPNSFVTHVSVVVSHEGQFFLFDPTFALTYHFAGRLLPISEGLRMIKSGKTDQIRTVMNGSVQRDVLARARTCNDFGPPRSAPMRCRLDLSTLFDKFRESEGEAWSAAGAPLTEAPLLKLFLKGVFNVGPGLNPESHRRFIDELRELGVPFHASTE